MLRHLVRKEILDNLLNQRFVAIAVFSIDQIPVGPFIHCEFYEARKAAFDGQPAEYQAEDPPPLEELPRCEVREPQLSNVLRSKVWAVVSHLACLFIQFLVSRVAFLRYDVR